MQRDPWYRRVRRWGQTNIREIDPQHYDIVWWQRYWRETGIEGVVLNAGGIVAYYPTTVPGHRRSPFLGDRDLFGDLVAAARALGLAVLARLDSSRTGADLFHEHPDWYAVDRRGQVYRDGDLYLLCPSSPYTRTYVPIILREIIDRYAVDGFFDNSWSGLSHARGLCYCPYCQRSFREYSGHDLPPSPDWRDPVFRQWVCWRYEQLRDLWRFYNQVTREVGGPDCLWIGNNGGDLIGQCQSGRDWLLLAQETPFLVLDFQARRPGVPLWANGEMGKLIRSVQPAVVVAESIAQYAMGRPVFRLTAQPEAEIRLWFAEAVAGGLRPWWHFIGALQDDQRLFRTAPALFEWHQRTQEYLVDREPVASIGLVWSQRAVDFYGQDDPEHRYLAHWRGMSLALIWGRLPYELVHVDRLESIDPARHPLLILPNLAALSDAHCRALRSYVASGGSLLATFETSLYDEWGQRRPDFALADLFGAHHQGETVQDSGHSYFRIVDRTGLPAAFAETTLLPFGGSFCRTRPHPDVRTGVPLTYVPPFPPFPPEHSYPRVTATDIPLLYLATHGSSRVVYTPTDLDRRCGDWHHPDHLTLLAGLVRWALNRPLPVRVAGPGLLDLHPYWQKIAAGARSIIHLVNLTQASLWHPPADALTPIGPVQVDIAVPPGYRAVAARLLVTGDQPPLATVPGYVRLVIPTIRDHEVVVVHWREE